MEQEKQK